MKPILLIEDSPDDAELTIAALSLDLTERVVLVHDGKEALDWLQRRGAYASRPPGDPVVVLLDLNMPRVDGFEVLREIRSTEALCELPVVGFTSSAEPADIAQAYHDGINAFVVKPIDFTEFVEVMKAVGQFWCVINRTPDPQG